MGLLDNIVRCEKMFLENVWGYRKIILNKKNSTQMKNRTITIHKKINLKKKENILGHYLVPQPIILPTLNNVNTDTMHHIYTYMPHC